MALLEGGHYGLVSHRDYGTGRNVCVYVKLTDSSQKAIEDYLASKAASRVKATIRLADQDVLLKIPDPHGSAKSFTLNLQALSSDANGSHECMRQKDSSDLELLDTMVHKLTVQATDDVYQTTKEKVAICDEESKKNCAKEIKPGGKYIGTKVKKIVQNGIVTRTVHAPAGSAVKVPSRATVSPPSRASPPSSHSMTESRHGATKAAPSKPTGNGHLAPRQTSASGAAASPMSSLTASSKTKSVDLQAASNKPKNAELQALPLRQRVIHLLAVRQFNKAELKAKLCMEGLSQEDQSTLNSLVTELATVNRSQQLVLLSDCYKEVDVNWKFYSEADRTQLRKRMDNLREGRPKHGSSQAPTAPAVGLPPHAATAENPLKRSPSNLDHSTSSSSNKRQRLSTSQTVQPILSADKRIEISIGPCFSSSGEPPSEVRGDEATTVSNLNSNDYLSRYTPLSDPEQRRKYKDDFNQEYQEYLQLHKALEKVSMKFAELADRLNQAADGSAEHLAIEKEIRRVYRSVKADAKYNERKCRMEYLHGKLSHIKGLVADYDNRMAEEVGDDNPNGSGGGGRSGS